MHQSDVAQAIAALRAQGKAVSHGNIRRQLGYGSLRDIVRYRNKLLPVLDATPATSAETATPAPILPERPLSLCQRCGLTAWFYVEVGRWCCPCGQCYAPQA